MPMDKQHQIIEMFDTIAKDYDKANHILSLGIDILWRTDACKRAFKLIQTPKIDCILDVACGTGDMMIQWQKQAQKHHIHIDSLIGADPSVKMLELAKHKVKNAQFITTEATNLAKIPDSSVDIVSITYGLRNVLDYPMALSEFSRVLKHGGLLVVLDFFKKQSPTLLDKCVGFYTKKMLPLIGGLISKNYQAYAYLPESMECFISPQDLTTHFQKVRIKPHTIKGYSANISHLVLGVKS